MTRSEQAYICTDEEVHCAEVSDTAAHMPDEETLQDVADFFKVLGDSTRMRILWALDLHELCVCDLSELLGMTKSAISHQLHALRVSHLVKTRRSGKNVFYSLCDDHVRDVLERALEHITE